METVLIDVRPMPPAQRHPHIFDTWQKLSQGGALELVNDHDPLPLYYQFACEHTGTFHWEYLEQGPKIWRVRITKGDFPDPGFKPKRPRAAAPKISDYPLVVDARPMFQKGEPPCAVIDEAAAQTPPGGSFVLMVPFEPVPLYAKLGREGFTHKSEMQPDGSWRVEFHRQK